MPETKSNLDILKKANKLLRNGDFLRAKNLYSKLLGCEDINQKTVTDNLAVLNARLKRNKKAGIDSDHALVVHVWHLDVLDELVEAAANLPDTTDQFVTLPAQFGNPERARIAAAFPRAQQVVVENVGQDVGALFQLMKQVDLGRYAFICKIHTKKGPNMPSEWRRALLDGVLRSKRQVQHIIERFRTEPQIMMAGARQLYLHGPSYIYKNTDKIRSVFSSKMLNFDLQKDDWGFIAGTFFWIRTSILIEISNCSLSFESLAYSPDGTLAHATERAFGLFVAIHKGSVLLQDLTLPTRLPDQENEYPTTLPRKEISLMKLLTPLAANTFLKSHGALQTKSTIKSPYKTKKRVAIFATYSEDGVISPQVAPYVAGLREIAKTIVVVFDNDLLPDEAKKLKGLADNVITGRHGEYDFGSYKRGIAWAREAGHLNQVDNLILCNDSCYGPINSFEPMFTTMDSRNHDFWGVTDSHQYSYHLQSYFLVFSKTIVDSPVFKKFFQDIKKQDNVHEVIQKYELGLTKTLINSGFKAGAMIENNLHNIHVNDTTYSNSPIFPIYTIERGSPLLKVKAMKYPHTNLDGANRVLRLLETKDYALYKTIISDLDIYKNIQAEEIAFSLILPTRNRAKYISRAIRSVLCQTHKNFELIIVDDGSIDETKKIIEYEFREHLDSGLIRYIQLKDNSGVCVARNIGISLSKNPWIGYIDSDNTIRSYMLTMFANTIIQNPGKESFYSKIFSTEQGREIGKDFDRADLLAQNFIDLGAYVHSRSLVQNLGGFDQNLRRLVDWDMIIRHTKEKDPVFIPRVCIDYDEDVQIVDRISVRESVVKALTAVWAKHSPKPTVSTVIVSYNHEEFITEAIESALAQRGEFNHEIVIADDGSTDSTPEIIANYVKKHPYKIRSIGRNINLGISENYHHAFAEAEGQFIAVLEGDDYWTDPEKLIKQATFLKQNEGASMVLSRIELFDMQKNTKRLLKRQEGLPAMLSAKHFADNEHLNLIVNLSCCMFRSEIMKRLPEVLYHPRLSEIALAFYHDRLGGIGFLPEVMSTYRLNDKSVWSGANLASKHQQAIDVRECAMRVARPVYRATIQKHIDQRRKMLESEHARQPPAATAS